MTTRSLLLLFGSVLAACSANDSLQTTDPVSGIVAGQITIALAKTTYSVSDLTPSSGQGVRATLGNTADQPFYSRIGDAFNGAAEQSPLFVANGSDAALEREQGSDWIAVTGMQLVEGVKVVTLRPGKTYELIAQSSAAAAGRYRITIVYREAPTAEATRRVTSAVFDVR
jgi:hypothetical protein